MFSGFGHGPLGGQDAAHADKGQAPDPHGGVRIGDSLVVDERPLQVSRLRRDLSHVEEAVGVAGIFPEELFQALPGLLKLLLSHQFSGLVEEQNDAVLPLHPLPVAFLGFLKLALFFRQRFLHGRDGGFRLLQAVLAQVLEEQFGVSRKRKQPAALIFDQMPVKGWEGHQAPSKKPDDLPLGVVGRVHPQDQAFDHRLGQDEQNPVPVLGLQLGLFVGQPQEVRVLVHPGHVLLDQRIDEDVEVLVLESDVILRRVVRGPHDDVVDPFQIPCIHGVLGIEEVRNEDDGSIQDSAGTDSEVAERLMDQILEHGTVTFDFEFIALYVAGPKLGDAGGSIEFPHQVGEASQGEDACRKVVGLFREGQVRDVRQEKRQGDVVGALSTLVPVSAVGFVVRLQTKNQIRIDSLQLLPDGLALRRERFPGSLVVESGGVERGHDGEHARVVLERDVDQIFQRGLRIFQCRLRILRRGLLTPARCRKQQKEGETADWHHRPRPS